MPFVNYEIPADKIYSDSEFLERIQANPPKKVTPFTVQGELVFHDRNGHFTVGFQTKHLLPDSPSIKHEAKAATWLATQTGTIVCFEFNDYKFRAHPHQDYIDLIMIYHYYTGNDAFKNLQEIYETMSS